MSDLSLGTVSQIRACCFELQPNGQAPRVSLTPASIFDVQLSVTLMCLNNEIDRYYCPIHGTRTTKAAG